MENLENNELEPVVKTTTKSKSVEPKPVELTWLEKEIMGRRNQLNFPALQAFFSLSETELQTILNKLPPAEDCNC